MRVRASFCCGWCGRDAGAVVVESGRLAGRSAVYLAPPGQPLTRGYPTCAHCGGPLFLDEWQQVYPELRLGVADLRPRRGRPPRSAA